MGMNKFGLAIMGMVLKIKSLGSKKTKSSNNKAGCVSLIDINVFEEKVDVLPKIFGMQKNMLQGVPGFVSAALLKGPNPQQFGIFTQWESVQDLEEWKKQAAEKGGKHMQAMLRGESKVVQPPYTSTRWDVVVASD